MKVDHNCQIEERYLPANAVSATYTFKCPECKQRWQVTIFPGGRGIKERIGRHRYLKVKGQVKKR